MRKSNIWADETVLQATAYLLGMDLGVLSMDCRPGEINIFRKDGSTPDADNISHPCLVIGKTLGYALCVDKHFHLINGGNSIKR